MRQCIKKTKILILCICSLFLCCLCACSNFEKDRSTTDLESEIFQEESVVSEKESSNDKVMEQSVTESSNDKVIEQSAETEKNFKNTLSGLSRERVCFLSPVWRNRSSTMPTV